MAENNLALSEKIANKATGTPVQTWVATMQSSLVKRNDTLKGMLPRGQSSERFVQVIASYLRLNAGTLFKCSPESLINSVYSIAQSGLDPSLPNEASLVPFGDRCTVIRGYKGYLKMARRSPEIAEIDCGEFYENDSLTYARGSNSHFEHTWALGDRGNIRGFYAYAKLKSGGVHFDIMDIPDVLHHAKRFTRASSKGPFAGLLEQGIKHENFIAYGLKTALIRLVTRKLDMLSDFAGAIGEESGDTLHMEVEAVEVTEQ
jgi:recombination protein RecT